MKFQSEAQRIKYEEDYRPAYDALMKCYPFILDAIEDEVWKPIAGYEEFYHISTYGRIKSFYGKKPIIRKPTLTIDGYLQVVLCLDGKPKPFRVHVLVATAFISNVDKKPEVNHRIGCKFNCHVSNLEWSTHAENQQHAYDNGLHVGMKGTQHPLAKLKDEEIILYIRNNPDELTGSQLAEKCGMAECTISEIQTGKRWGHVGGTVRKSKRPRVSEEIRAKIRADWATGQYTKAALARKYGVHPKTIWKIIHENDTDKNRQRSSIGGFEQNKSGADKESVARSGTTNINASPRRGNRPRQCPLYARLRNALHEGNGKRLERKIIGEGQTAFAGNIFT